MFRDEKLPPTAALTVGNMSSKRYACHLMACFPVEHFDFKICWPVGN
jgi:hypothetical protein